MSTASLFKWRYFLPEIILLNVRWYCRYSLSYRDLEEMMQERGAGVDHSTINRWVLRYAPELEKCIRPHLKPTNDSWRVDETDIKIKGVWKYLYRAVDKNSCDTTAEVEFPPESVVKLAVTFLLDPDAISFEGCQVGVQREQVYLLQQYRKAHQAKAA